MAIKLMSVNGINNENIAEFIVDTEDEKSQIPVEYMVQGTEARVIEGGKRYRLDCNLQWVEIKPYSSGGGSGGPTVEVESVSVTQNGTVNAPYGKAYTPIYVDVENTYVAADEGKVVSNGALVAQTAHSTITQNGTFDTTLNDSVEINVPPVLMVGKDIIFIDYDGTILYSYTKEEFANLSELPENPTHSGLVAQGWNWTKEQINTQLIAIPNQPIWVGQMYITQSGDTEIDVYFSDSVRLAPVMMIAVNGTVTVDWGDNTTPNTVTGNSLTTRQAIPHTYTEVGNYTIVIHVVSGSFTFYGTLEPTLLRKANAVKEENAVYANTIRNIRIGNGITSIGDRAFYDCNSLTSITISSSITSIKSGAFTHCFSLTSVVIPSGVTSIENEVFVSCDSLVSVAIPSSVNKIEDQAFGGCNSLTSITVPSGVTSIGEYAFSTCFSLTSIVIPSGVTSIQLSTFYCCYSLTSIVIPSGVTSIGPYAFDGCHSLMSITIPSGVTSIDEHAFYGCYCLASIIIPNNVTSIGRQAFDNCYSLASITIPNSVTSISSEAFRRCYGLGAIYFKSITPPTVANSKVWTNLPTDCVIYVPTGRRTTYMSTTNYPDPSIYTYVEEA